MKSLLGIPGGSPKGFFGPGIPAPNIQVFDANAIWNKPAAPPGRQVISVTFIVRGSGSGGAAGACYQNLAGATAPGGYGGGAGGYAQATYIGAVVAAAVTITVGPGGVGGVGLPNNAAFVAGTSGALSSAVWPGGFSVLANGGNQQAGGAANVAATGAPTNVITINGPNGGNGGAPNGPPGTAASSGGVTGPTSGAGGGQTNDGTNTAGNGGASPNGVGGLGAVANPAVGAAGGPSAGGGAALDIIGAGGSITGGNGGDGLNPGDGGGGGGGAGFRNITGGAQNPSAGGKGHGGRVIVITVFG